MFWENRLFAYAKTKTQISFAVTAKLISAFVFATQIVQSLYFLNPNFHASSHFLWLPSPVCVGPGRKPRRLVFSQGSYVISQTTKTHIGAYTKSDLTACYYCSRDVNRFSRDNASHFPSFGDKTHYDMSCAMRKPAFCFVFATQIVQALHFLNMKFQASSHIMWLYSLASLCPVWSETPKTVFS